MTFSVSPTSPLVGQNATYTADPSLGCDVLACDWTFGDGGTETGAEVTHRYETAGIKQVTLTNVIPLETADVVVRPSPPLLTGPSAPIQLGDVATFTAHTAEPATFTLFENGVPVLTTSVPSADASLPTPLNVAGPRTISVQATVAGATSDPTATSVFVNQPPVASFTVSPRSPTAGQTVTFTSTSTDPDGDALSAAWDLNGDNVFTDAIGAKASTVYTTAGSRTVRLQVADPNGGSGTAFSSVDVAPTKNKKSGPKLLSPFPRVRYAGRLSPRGVFITLLAVRMPKGARFKATCAKRCPAKIVKAKARSTGDRILRKLRGTYRPGAVLRISITKKDRIGKYTLITIPKGGAPRRTDKCLWPSSKKPRKCP